MAEWGGVAEWFNCLAMAGEAEVYFIVSQIVPLHAVDYGIDCAFAILA